MGRSYSDGRTVELDLCMKIMDEELTKLKALVGDEAYNKGRYRDAASNVLRPAWRLQIP